MSTNFSISNVFVTESAYSPTWKARSYTLSIAEGTLSLLEDGADPSTAISVPISDVRAKKLRGGLGVKLDLGQAGHRVLSWGTAVPGMGTGGMSGGGGTSTGVALQRSNQVISALEKAQQAA